MDTQFAKIAERSTHSALIYSCALATVTVVVLAIFFLDGFQFLFREWTRPEYSHGVLIPIISAALTWLKRNEITAVANRGSWTGIPVLGSALFLALLGKLATIYLVVHVAIVLSLIGLALSFLGWRAVKVLWFPLFFLFFMIPLPDFIVVRLSADMQLLSSSIGVWFIRLFGVSVFLEGNVIDLGDFKMQVVEACNGLRYLFPLMTFGLLIAYLYRGPFLHRLAIFLSTIPITIFMNSIRIGLIGVLYANFGVNAANGLLHDFEGWAVFIVCLAFLLLEVKLLSYLVPGRPKIFDMFSVSRGWHRSQRQSGGRP